MMIVRVANYNVTSKSLLPPSSPELAHLQLASSIHCHPFFFMGIVIFTSGFVQNHDWPGEKVLCPPTVLHRLVCVRAFLLPARCMQLAVSLKSFGEKERLSFGGYLLFIRSDLLASSSHVEWRVFPMWRVRTFCP
eukprot:scpid59081/ scgid34148/ 